MTNKLNTAGLDAIRRAVELATHAQTGVTLKHDEAAALLAHIDAQDAEITALKALRQRVDDADIGMLSDAHGDTLPLRLAREWFGYIWHGDQKPEDVDKNTSAQDAEIAALREAVRNLGGDPDQAWYWTDAWQAKEREADEDLRAGRYADADDIDTLLAD